MDNAAPADRFGCSMFPVMRCLLVASLLVAMVPASALTLGDVRVPLASRSQSSILAAEKVALGQLLVQLTGRADAESLPGAQGVLANPQQWLSQYGFEAQSGGQLLVAHFDVRALGDALLAAGVPVWPLARPGLLLWLANPNGVVNEVLGGGLKQAAATRGLPLRLPHGGDAVTAADIRGRFMQPVQDASKSYGADLLATAASYPGTSVRVRWWLYQKEELLTQGEVEAADTVTAQNQLIDRLADAVATRYVVGGSPRHFALTTDGVPDLRAWRDISQYLQGMTGISHADVTGVAGARLSWSLDFSGSADLLGRLLTINPHLRPCDTRTPAGNADATAAPLAFCWQP